MPASVTDVAAVVAASPWAERGGVRWRPAVAAVASPMCQAVDWANWCLTSDTPADAMFLKLAQPDMAAFIDVEAAHAGALAGMQAGVAPAVRLFLPALGALGVAWLLPPWRAARLDDLVQPDVMRAALAAKQALRRGPPLARQWDVFARVAAHARLAAATATPLPADMPALLAQVAAAGAALTAAGCDSAPCHNDGQASNLMLGPNGEVWLADFDCAGQADPHYDIAVLLNEAYMVEDEWRAALEMAEGRCDERVLNRCRAYAVADDVMAGLQGLILSATSPRRDVEFLKLGEWRLLRARMALREPGLAERLGRV